MGSAQRGEGFLVKSVLTCNLALSKPPAEARRRHERSCQHVTYANRPKRAPRKKAQAAAITGPARPTSDGKLVDRLQRWQKRWTISPPKCDGCRQHPHWSIAIERRSAAPRVLCLVRLPLRSPHLVAQRQARNPLLPQRRHPRAIPPRLPATAIKQWRLPTQMR